VTVGNNSYTPASTTVQKGTTVTWTWAQNSVDHTVTFSDGQTSATMSSGTYSRTFSTAGEYAYYCKVHGASMSGTVTVQ
jgi:plastocyanin